MASLSKTFIDEVPAPAAGYKIHWHDTIKGFGLLDPAKWTKPEVIEGYRMGVAHFELQTFRLRLAALEKKAAEEGLLLTETQIAALERKREEQQESR
jgi:hypothetical protein